MVEPEEGADLQEPPSSAAPLLVLNPDRPKVIDWEDLQQELARLWSLSSALKKAKERKEALARRLESVLEVRKESLRQLNELEEIRKQLERRKLMNNNSLLHSKKASEYAKIKKENLCNGIRLLLVAGETLSGAHQQLGEVHPCFNLEAGHGQLKHLLRMLKLRQQYMVAQVALLYPVKSSMVHTTEETDSSSGKSRDSSEVCSQIVNKPQPSSFTIFGLQPATPFKKMSIFGDKKEAQKSATALGYIAHAVLLIASYLNVPLRYPLRLGGSRSFVLDYAPYVEPASSDLTSSQINGIMMKPIEFPLFLEGQDTTRAAYAMFLLNKDIEQLLDFVGGQSLGARHLLPNLKELVNIIQSHEYIDGL